ncbi:MAG: ATP synthase subunit I [Stenotrophomonas sp.]|uniref:ATP synthase subunit I n=1 Tax=Stenotrophomonas capsici TaxID=3110230 RepID=A0ABU5V549_9GAMM|nr:MULTISPECIES: ATP synthase subunit I [unclassified Stenotrophomonas]MBD9536816.1 ATP synthase subunit I [Stenotrophomonas sp. STM01]MEA5667859.1 ATP synthase subunit I [Stenotrophomonas sp. MH1]
MLNSVDAGRRLMLRAAVYPLAAVVVLALAFLFMGPKYALGALVSGVTVVAGTVLAAWVGLGGGVQAAGSAMIRLFLGFALKIVLIVVVLVLAFVWWRLPPLALLAAIPVALMFQVLALARR